MSAPAVERVIVGARLWTGGGPRPGDDAVAIGGGRILALGAGRDLAAAAPDAEVVDAGGATLTPGITDAHFHLLAWARSLDELDLFGAAGPDEVGRRLAEHAARRPGDSALVGRGWDENGWSAPPHRAALDRALPGRPALLHSHDFHSLWLNGEALRRAGIGPRTPDPESGRIERDARGEPTGVLREHAVRLAAGLAPPPGEGQDRAALARAAAALHALGITAVHVFEGSRSRRLLRELARDERAGLRVVMSLPHESLEAAIAAGARSGAGDLRFRIGGIKLFADGTLGSRTAALLAPFADTGTTGMELIPPAELRRLVARAAGAGLGTAIHAIGDRAVRSALDAFEAALDARRAAGTPDRIEHVQLADPADLPRFAALGVTASLQPTHATSDQEAAGRAWPDRLDRAYPWRSLLDRGARVVFGSDAPVEPPGAAATLHAAVTRRRPDGTPPGGWTPRERVSLDEALTACTEGPARLAGTWPRLGRLAAGAEADVVLWDRDLHAADPATLHAARPRLTLLAGRVVFRAGESEASRAARGEAA